MHDDADVARLQRWQESGGRWRVLTRATDTVVIALLTCDIGEEVDRLSGTGPALLAYLGDRDNSEDDITPARPVRPGPTAVVRDRDLSGRPRNSRPRDALGRPLEPGAPGVSTMPDDLNPAPVEALQQAQKLLGDGFPFHAHEVLEAAWKSAPPDERELWRGLAQFAVGLTHARRGNAIGAARLLLRAADRIGPYEHSAPHSIAAAELSVWARATAADIKADHTAVDARIPRLRRSTSHE